MLSQEWSWERSIKMLLVCDPYPPIEVLQLSYGNFMVDRRMVMLKMRSYGVEVSPTWGLKIFYAVEEARVQSDDARSWSAELHHIRQQRLTLE